MPVLFIFKYGHQQGTQDIKKSYNKGSHYHCIFTLLKWTWGLKLLSSLVELNLEQAHLAISAFPIKGRNQGFPGGSVVKILPANAGDMGLIPGWEDPLEKEMETHSGILAWEILQQRSLVEYSPWGQKRVGHDLATKEQ